jgi:hypothetical protein
MVNGGCDSQVAHSPILPLSLSLSLIFILLGCGKESVKPVPDLSSEFNATNAFAHVETLVAIGPRVSSTPGSAKAKQYIEAELNSYGLDVEFQVFDDETPMGTKKFCNIIAYPKWRGKERILLCSHYDSKWLDKVNFVGANDSGSSTGLLLELARVLTKHPMKPTPYFVFFDGEESFGEWSDTNGLFGSRYLVRAWKQRGELQNVRAMILADMIGDKDLNVGMPPSSTPALVKAVFDASQELGYRSYFSYQSSDILDDHTPFLRVGIPAVDLIDFEYGSARRLNDYWHTDQDTLDKISPRSIEIVGRTILKALPKFAAPKPSS